MSRSGIGRWCDLTDTYENPNIELGMDFRLPQHRRAVFKRFYQFQLKYRAHPGCVYFMLPELWKGLDIEDHYWIAFLNANTQNPITTWFFQQIMPHVPENQRDIDRLSDFFNENWARLEFDTDRRYQKKDFIKSVKTYSDAIRETHGQEAFFQAHSSGANSPEERFELVWRAIRKHFYTFGRLATWSYMDYLFIVGLDVEPGGLMLDDMKGSMSHRNGLAKVLGRDDLDWHKTNEFTGDYTDEEMDWLESEWRTLWAEIKEEIDHPHCSLITLESAFCTYKGWFRMNRRYPNVYVDMFHDRIRKAEQRWGMKLKLFWEARNRCLPNELLQEKSDRYGGLTRHKQNWFKETGQVIHMELDWPEFANTFKPE